jgi:hypothetical protein
VGDIVLKLDGEEVQASQPEDLEIFPAMVRQYPVGSKVKLEGVRDAEPLALEVELPASPRSTRELLEYNNRQFDFSARDLTFQDRVQRAPDMGQEGPRHGRRERRLAAWPTWPPGWPWTASTSGCGPGGAMESWRRGGLAGRVS